MQSLAAFVMRGRLNAILVIVGASVVPLLVWAGGAALALVTLRRGWQDGLTVAAGALAGLAAIYGLSGSPELALGFLGLWLPVLVLALWLRYTISLSAMFQLAAGLGALGVALMHLAFPDQAALWSPLLERFGERISDPKTLEAWQLMRERMLPVMTGLWALSVLMMVLLSLLVGRWLQAMLYNPGGFRREFHALNLGRGMALVAMVLILAAMFDGRGVINDLAMVVSAVFAFQALSLVHAVVAARGMNQGWLVAQYVLLPLAFELFVVVGIADAAFEWRRRLLDRTGPSDSA